MKKNVGRIDQWIRVILGLGLLSLIFLISGGWRWIGLLGAVLIVTAVLDFCPIYAIFGLSTKKDK